MVDAARMTLEIVTPSAVLFNGPVDSVVMPARDGEYGVLPGHSVTMVAVTSGELRFKTGEITRSMAVTSGYAEIAPDLVIMIINAAEWADDINLERARKALARSEARLNDPKTSPLEKIHARHAYQRATARIKVALIGEQNRSSHSSTNQSAEK